MDQVITYSISACGSEGTLVVHSLPEGELARLMSKIGDYLTGLSSADGFLLEAKTLGVEATKVADLIIKMCEGIAA